MTGQTANLIPYPVRSEINQIEPRLDIFWQDQLMAIFNAIAPEVRAQAAGQLLAPKEIFWTKSPENSFTARPAK